MVAQNQESTGRVRERDEPFLSIFLVTTVFEYEVK